jgi:hypothetical protein
MAVCSQHEKRQGCHAGTRDGEVPGLSLVHSEAPSGQTPIPSKYRKLM